MIVRLAGYNIDSSQIDNMSDQNMATPETLSAAYARISRSAKSVSELREEAISEVAKARRSNQKIIFEMGHSSVAEHAVFNFDIIGVSRILTEIIQRSRLASFTEKSQRYVTLSNDYIIPEELEELQSKADYQIYMKEAYQAYFDIYTKLKKYLENTGFKGKKRELEGRAKEDARYVLPLSVQTQMGMTINARSLAILLRRLHGSELAEARKLYQALLDAVRPVVPSLIRYTESDEFLKWSVPKLYINRRATPYDETSIIAATPDPDDLVLASLIFSSTGYDFENIIRQVRDFSYEDKYQIFQSLYKDMKSFHSLPRCFELADFTIETTMSASCFAQFKRHRMCTIIKSDYLDGEEYVMPPLIEEAGCADYLVNVINSSVAMYDKLENKNPGLGAYARTNAHKCRVLMKANLRELHHFARLRSDKHAQWEIRELSQRITKLINKRAPLSSATMMGKDEFGEKFQNNNSGS